MKKLIILLTFLLAIGTVKAFNYTCTSDDINKTFIYECADCVCTMPDCQECPILPNETIIIQNLTLPDFLSPNVTCNFDTVGFTDAIIECNNAKDDLASAYMTCDSNLTKGRLYENELTQKQNEINSCKAELNKKDEEKTTYGFYGFLLAGGIAVFWYQQKVKPSAELRTERD